MQKPRGDTIMCKLLQAFDYMQRKDGANNSGLRSSQRNRPSHNDSLQKTQKLKFDHRIETDYIDIVSGVLQGNTYLFIICLDYVLRSL